MLDSNSCVAEITYKLLYEKVFDTNIFINNYDLNRRKIQRYTKIIKNRLFDMGLYHIEISYVRSEDLYKCTFHDINKI